MPVRCRNPTSSSMLSSQSPSPSPSLFIEQMRCLEAQVPVRMLLVNPIIFMLMREQAPGIVSSSSPTEHVVTANQILANARSMREPLPAQSTEASKRLSDAVLDIVLYSEKGESTARLLTF